MKPYIQDIRESGELQQEIYEKLLGEISSRRINLSRS